MGESSQPPAGYSGTPLVNKLGIKAGMTVYLSGEPANYFELIGELPDGVTSAAKLGKAHDFMHCFVASEADLAAKFPKWKAALAETGMIWISWPKRTSGVECDLTEDKIRAIGLAIGLVDVKVCAVDQTWSGLKFMYRVKDRRK